MKTFRVHIIKPERGKTSEADFVFYVEAKDARQAFNKIDEYTGVYECSFIEVVKADARIYKK